MPVFISRFLRGHRVKTLILALILASLVVTGFVWAHKKIHIIADGKTTTIHSFHNKPEDVLAQAGIYLGPKDEYRMRQGEPSSVIPSIEVYRAVPVTVLYNGAAEVVLTGKPTVKEVAEALNISAAIRTIPDGMTRPVANMQIQVLAVKEQEEEREIEIPRTIIRQPEATLEKGIEGVVEDGSDGRKKVRMKVRYEDGVEVGTEVLGETVLVQPKPQIIQVGTRETVDTSRGALRFRRVMQMEATAYHPTDGPGNGITASGLPARRGIIAVDPRVIPLGTRVYIPGYGLALAADTGGAIKGNIVDLCMEEFEECWQFGRRMVKVYILSD